MLNWVVSAQIQVSGKVRDENQEPLIGATVRVLGTTSGTTTDEKGLFSLSVESGKEIQIDFLGYKPIVFKAAENPVTLVMEADAEQLEGVIIESETTFLDDLNPIQNQVILESELLKAACCNLSESFETNTSVDVSFSDAVSGSKMIRMLGLDGRYVQINRENIPLVRGLSGRYGLGFVPGPWIQSIDVGKGAGSVVNGYESMTGQINLEFKKPEISETLYLNGYVNSFGRQELNANHATSLGEKWSAGFLLHADNFTSEIDRNDDGFLDLPKSRQINFMNRYKYEGDRLVSQIGINVMRDEKAGGETGFNFGSDHLTSSLYGFSYNTTRLELYGKTGVLFPKTPYQGFGFIYSGSYQSIDAGFGRRAYEGTEKTLYGNLIYQNILGNSFHQYKTGASVLFDDFDEIFTDSSFNRQEVVPGAYFEYSFLPNDDFSLVAGNRLDFHNLYGTFYTPRLHARYAISQIWTVRAAVGRGFRVPNVITENNQFLVSSRQLIIEEEIDPEISWNVGGSIVATLPVGDRSLQLIADYFHTSFVNQMVVDQDVSASQVRIYNLDGRSFANSFQLEASLKINAYLDLRGAYKLYDVRTTLDNELRRQPYISRDRIFLNVAYATRYDKWKADLTLQWVGSKRLPNTGDRPVEFQSRNFSADWANVNTQVSRGFRWGEIYLGAENLLDFRQGDPIIDPENPFGENFDASIIWGPIAGRLVYAGFRYKIKRRS